MDFTQRRRGRPRREHLKVDLGTKELQHKRKMLMENGQMQDPCLGASLLGVLYAHESISKPLYEAGCFFGELGYRYEPCLGHTFRRRFSGLTLMKGGSPCHDFSLLDGQDEKRTRAWRKALEVLKQAGRHPYRSVLEVVFYDQDLYGNALSRSPFKEIEALRQGLERLDMYFKGGLKDRQGRLCGLALNPVRSTISQPPLRERQLHTPL